MGVFFATLLLKVCSCAISPNGASSAETESLLAISAEVVSSSGTLLVDIFPLVGATTESGLASCA
jgi:hypothetical protein